MTVAEQLEALRATERGEVVLLGGLTYDGAEPVCVFVRKRGHRYDLDDGGRAVEKAGISRWREVAERTVDEYALNVNRAGVVFVGAVEGRDLAWLAERVAETSRAVYGDLLDTAA